MHFTDNPRRWRKVLVSFALAKVQFDRLDEPEGGYGENWETGFAVTGLLIGSIAGLMMSLTPVTAIMAVCQVYYVLSKAWYSWADVWIPIISVVGGGGTLFGAFVGCVGFAYGALKYNQTSLQTAPDLLLQALMSGFLIILPIWAVWNGLIYIVSYLVDLSILANPFVAVGGTFLLAATYTLKFFTLELGKVGKSRVYPEPPPKSRKPILTRLLFRRGRRINTPLPIVEAKPRTTAKW